MCFATQTSSQFASASSRFGVVRSGRSNSGGADSLEPTRCRWSWARRIHDSELSVAKPPGFTWCQDVMEPRGACRSSSIAQQRALLHWIQHSCGKGPIVAEGSPMSRQQARNGEGLTIEKMLQQEHWTIHEEPGREGHRARTGWILVALAFGLLQVQGKVGQFPFGPGPSGISRLVLLN